MYNNMRFFVFILGNDNNVCIINVVIYDAMQVLSMYTIMKQCVCHLYLQMYCTTSVVYGCNDETICVQLMYAVNGMCAVNVCSNKIMFELIMCVEMKQCMYYSVSIISLYEIMKQCMYYINIGSSELIYVLLRYAVMANFIDILNKH